MFDQVIFSFDLFRHTLRPKKIRKIEIGYFFPSEFSPGSTKSISNLNSGNHHRKLTKIFHVALLRILVQKLGQKCQKQTHQAFEENERFQRNIAHCG